MKEYFRILNSIYFNLKGKSKFMTNKMAALRFYGPHNYQVEEIPLPQLSDQDILIKVSACGLCGSDIRTLKFGHLRITPPFTLGHEVTGEIIEVGPHADSPFNYGERIAIAPVVYCGTCGYCQNGHSEYCENYREIGQTWPGGFAEYMLIPQDALRHGVIHPIPDSLDSISATLSEPLGACLHAIDRMDLEVVRSAAIFGAGTIGCLMLQLLRDQGVKEIAVIDPNVNRLELAQKIGADFLINNRVENAAEKIKSLSSEGGVDLAITATAAPAALIQAIEIMNKGGQIIAFAGLPKKQSVLEIDMNTIHYKCLKISGSSIYAPRHHRKALDLIADGTIRVDEMVTTFPLREFRTGAEAAINGEVIKAVFLP